jgi:hypothetical protein
MRLSREGSRREKNGSVSIDSGFCVRPAARLLPVAYTVHGGIGGHKLIAPFVDTTLLRGSACPGSLCLTGGVVAVSRGPWIETPSIAFELGRKYSIEHEQPLSFFASSFAAMRHTACGSYG